MNDGLQIPEHLWSILELMEQEMGVPQNSLVCQAIFTLARLNGYVVSGHVPVHNAVSETGLQGVANYEGAIASSPEHSSSKDMVLRLPPPEHDVEKILNEQESGVYGEVEVGEEAGVELYMLIPGKEPILIEGDEFIIGRGKTCDCVIDSNRVSRQHARITREGDTFILEDLNSSNGTFFVEKQGGFDKKHENFDKKHEKIMRREISNEDEFIFGTERVIFYIQ
ncbi:MAG: FHA domain-containing protein [Proteobacteria bacterium]|nr:FHA domain-containing protein [Cystobacterineae bacterium]MCL2258715.1 FHA domain-containing protein [Cystobacterineae bacterium]MCL2315005.1 FHA domain-containing protein [Pseudomonadota bacterium]